MWRAYWSSDKTIRLFASKWTFEAVILAVLEMFYSQQHYNYWWVYTVRMALVSGWVADLTLGYVFMAVFSFKHQKCFIWLKILLLHCISSYIKYYAKLMLQQSFINMIWKEDFLILIQLASVVYNRTALFYCLAILVEETKIHMLYVDGQWFLFIDSFISENWTLFSFLFCLCFEVVEHYELKTQL